MSQNPYLMSQIAQGFNFNPGGAFMQGRQDRMGMIAAQYQQQLAQMQMAQAQAQMEQQRAAAAQQQALQSANQKAAAAFGLDPSMASLGLQGMTQFKDAVVPKAEPRYDVISDPAKVSQYGFPKGSVLQIAPTGQVSVLREPATGPDPKDLRATENEYRDEFNTLTKDYRSQFDAYSRIVASAADPSAAGDLALIFNYMKLLDPGSTVREGEFANAQNSGGIPARIVSMYNNVVSGERLAPPMRADFLNRSGRLFESAQERAARIADAYTQRAVRQGIDPRNVVTDFAAGIEPPPKSATDYIQEEMGANSGRIIRQ